MRRRRSTTAPAEVPSSAPRSATVRPSVGHTVMPIRRHTVASMTVDAIRERILRGTYPEGEPLRQEALAEVLGVSRIPVREALRQLEAEGLVIFSPHRGAVVSTLSLQEIEELFELRADVESDLLRRAIPNVTPAQLDQAMDVLDAYDAALRDGDIAQWGALNWHFHATLYAPADRTITMGVVNKLHQHSDRYLRMQLALTHGESRASKEHRAIASAVRRRNVQKASQLLRQHILGAGRSLRDFLDEHRSQEEQPAKKRAKARVER